MDVITYGLSKKYTDRTAVEIVEQLASGFTFKGEVNTYADLPSSGQQNGDIWIVKTATEGHPAGKYAWSDTTHTWILNVDVNAWGEIYGSIENQTDLIERLDAIGFDTWLLNGTARPFVKGEVSKTIAEFYSYISSLDNTRRANIAVFFEKELNIYRYAGEITEGAYASCFAFVNLIVTDVLTSIRGLWISQNQIHQYNGVIDSVQNSACLITSRGVKAKTDTLVPKIRTIAGKDLQDDITAAELKAAVGATTVVANPTEQPTGTLGSIGVDGEVLSIPAAPVQSVNTKTGTVILSGEDIKTELGSATTITTALNGKASTEYVDARDAADVAVSGEEGSYYLPESDYAKLTTHTKLLAVGYDTPTNIKCRYSGETETALFYSTTVNAILFTLVVTKTASSGRHDVMFIAYNSEDRNVFRYDESRNLYIGSMIGQEYNATQFYNYINQKPKGERFGIVVYEATVTDRDKPAKQYYYFGQFGASTSADRHQLFGCIDANHLYTHKVFTDASHTTNPERTSVEVGGGGGGYQPDDETIGLTDDQKLKLKESCVTYTHINESLVSGSLPSEDPSTSKFTTESCVFSAVSDKVPDTRTVAGVDLQDDITSGELKTALNVPAVAVASTGLSNLEAGYITINGVENKLIDTRITTVDFVIE